MKRILYFAGAALGLLIGGCSDDYLDINENPNKAVSSTPELVLTNALNITSGKLTHNEIGSYWSGQWAPSGSFSGFDGERTYNITSTFRTNVWTVTYNNLSDYKVVETEALKAGKPSLAGIARVMKAFNYQIIVDAYGNAPYSQALKGTSAILPAYDDASVIYDSLLVDIDKAKAYLAVPISGTNPSAGTSDIIFGGNTAKWIKFANTLKLRILLRQSGVKNVAAQIAAIAADAGGFLGAGEDVSSNPGYLRTTGKMNQFYEFFGYNAGNARSSGHDAYAINSFMIDNLKANNDPRLSRIAYPTTADGVTYKGVPLGGQSDEYLFPKISGVGPAVLPQDGTAGTLELFKRSQTIMTAAESFFLQAEAVQRGFYAGDVKALYQAGIVESFRLMGVPNAATAAVTYYSQLIPNVNYGVSPNKIEAIITQKWFALANFGGFEAWTEFRRTGFPNVPLSIKASGSGQPVRLIYPQSEYSNNAANANAQGELNVFSSRIFWDVN